MPRHSQLTPDTHAAIVRAIKTGITRKAAAYIGGVSDRTLRSWCERGAKGEEPYASFVEDMAQADSEVEQAMAATILHCAVKKKDWRAAQFWLERRSPEWRNGTNTGDDSSPREINITVSGPPSRDSADK